MGIKKIITSYTDMFKDFIFYKYNNSYIHFDNIFFVKEVKDNHIVMSGNKKLYGLSLTSTEDVPHFLNNISQTAMEFLYEKDAQLYVFFTKNEVIDSDIKLVNNYIFSKNELLLRRIASSVPSKILTGNKIIEAIFNIVDYNNYYIEKDIYKLKPLIDFSFSNDELDIAGFNFKRMFSEAVYKNAIDYKLFQLTGASKSFDNFNIHKILKSDFRGYIHIYLNFNYYAIKSKINMLYNEISKFEKNKHIRDAFSNFRELIDKKEFSTPFVVSNVLALINKESAFETAKHIANTFNSNIIEKKIFKKDILYRTPILERDIDFDFFAYPKDFSRIISTFEKENNFNTKNPINITGKNLIGNYTTFSFSESNPPHAIIFAKSRSGKSFFLQKVIAQTMRYDAKENIAHKIDELKIRYFDKGLSAIKFVSKLQEQYPSKIQSIVSFEHLYFNFFDLETNELGKVNETDFIFSLSIINIFLELNKTNVINAEEEFHLKEAVNTLFYKKDYQGVPLNVLEKIEGFKPVINKIYQKYPSMQYKNSTTKDLMNMNDKEFDFLTKPRISDIINYLELKKRNSFISDIQKKVIENLLSKLYLINAIEKFQYYSLFNVKDANFFYLDIDEIEKLGEKMFVPIFWFLFYKFYKLDLQNAIKRRVKENKRGIPAFYLIEEAHNYMKYPSLEGFFESLSREAAKYNIHLIFVTQFISDLPDKVIGNLGNKVILPALAENSVEQIKELEKIWVKKPEYIEFFKENRESYLSFIEYDGGLFTLKPVITKEEAWLFDSES